MTKQPKPEETTAKPVTTAKTGKTLAVTGEPEDGVKLSDAIRAAIDNGKSPEQQIMVVGPKGGRWRAGRFFGPEPTIIDVADLTEADGLALTADPKLVVGPAFPSVPS